jgi:ubiquitin-like protein 5
LDVVEVSAKERMERRERGEVPARFGGTREQGVRNTMSTIAPAMGGGGRGGVDPLDRMPARGGGGDGDRMMQERVAAMGGAAPPAASSGPPTGVPT